MVNELLNELFDRFSKISTDAINMADSDTKFGYLEALRDVGLVIRELVEKYQLTAEDLQRYGENDEPQKVEIDRTGDYPNE